jgi:hypothetical protein
MSNMLSTTDRVFDRFSSNMSHVVDGLFHNVDNCTDECIDAAYHSSEFMTNLTGHANVFARNARPMARQFIDDMDAVAAAAALAAAIRIVEGQYRRLSVCLRELDEEMLAENNENAPAPRGICSPSGRKQKET